MNRKVHGRFLMRRVTFVYNIDISVMAKDGIFIFIE
jgi:hypothetical protein